jgi:hypothetical protein
MQLCPRSGRRFASPRERNTFPHCEETGVHRNIFRENKSARRIVIPDWRGTGDLGREYALVYRAGLLNKTGRPVGVGLPDKLYDFAHLVTSAGNLEENISAKHRQRGRQCEYRAKRI